ncbi:MAG: MurR/RpiR family transcriptional regulator [Lachnospiraceae bacterium]
MLKRDILKSVMLADAQNIVDTCHTTDLTSYIQAQKILLKAKHIYIIGLRTCEPVAQVLAHHLRILFEHVTILPGGSMQEIMDYMLHIGQKDVIVGISFPQYSMRTLKALEFASSRKANVITITDQQLSPINMYSPCHLIAVNTNCGFADSMSSALSVVNTLVVSLQMSKSKKLAHTRKEMGEIWDDYKVEETEDIRYTVSLDSKEVERV